MKKRRMVGCQCSDIATEALAVTDSSAQQIVGALDDWAITLEIEAERGNRNIGED